MRYEIEEGKRKENWKVKNLLGAKRDKKKKIPPSPLLAVDKDVLNHLVHYLHKLGLHNCVSCDTFPSYFIIIVVVGCCGPLIST